MALVEIGVKIDGAWRLVRAGRPIDMIAFEDEFGVPGPDPESGKMWRQVAWLAHRIDAPRTPFDTWLASVDEISADPEGVAQAKAEAEAAATAEPNGHPAAELADPFASEAATGAVG